MLYFLKSSDCVIPVPLQYADFQQKTASKTCFMKCCLHTHMFCHFQRGVFFKHTSSKKILHCLWSCWCSFCWWWLCRWMYEIRVIRIWRWIIWKWRASSSNRPSKRKCCLKRPKNKRWQVIKHIVKVTNQRSRNKKVRIKMKKRGQSTCYSRFHCSVKYHWSYGWCTTGWIFGSFSWHQYLHAPNSPNQFACDPVSWGTSWFVSSLWLQTLATGFYNRNKTISITLFTHWHYKETCDSSVLEHPPNVKNPILQWYNAQICF